MKTHITYWEQKLKELKPYERYKTLPDKNNSIFTRDIVAFLRCEMHSLIEKHGRNSKQAQRAQAAFERYYEEDRHSSLAPIEVVNASFIKLYHERTPLPSWDGSREGLKKRTEEVGWEIANFEQGQIWDSWEKENKIDFENDHPRFPRGTSDSKGNRLACNTAALKAMEADGLKPRKCPKTFVELADEISNYEKKSGQKYDPAMEKVWERRYAILRGEDYVDDNFDDPLVKTLLTYASEHHHGIAHVQRWKAALTAIGYQTGEIAMTLAEAEQNYQRFNKKRWGPVVERIKKLHPDQVAVHSQKPSKKPQTSHSDPLIGTLLEYASEHHHGKEHVRRWNAVLTALGHDTGEPAMTMVEMERCYDRFKKSRWKPVLERARALSGMPVASYVQFKKDGILDTRTDVFIKRTFDDKIITDIRYVLDTDNPNGMRQITWHVDIVGRGDSYGCLIHLPHNKETKNRTIPIDEVADVIVRGTTFIVDPSWKDLFLKWLNVEREMAIKVNGAGHPIVKHDLFGKMITAVKKDETTGDLEDQYKNFIDWLNGDAGQMQVDDSIIENRGTAASPEWFSTTWENGKPISKQIKGYTT